MASFDSSMFSAWLIFVLVALSVFGSALMLDQILMHKSKLGEA